MLTSLNVIPFDNKNKFIKIFNSIRGDKVKSAVVRSGGIAVNQLTYYSRSGKLKPSKLYRAAGNEKLILADENVAMPEGLTRFCSNNFSERLCVNMALGVLRKIKNPLDLKLGIFDPEAHSPDLLFEALKLCRNPVAVTFDLLPYDRIRRMALSELGASAVITRRTSELLNCDFVVAPTKICAYIPIKKNAVLLTAGKPYVRLFGEIYHSYAVTLPEVFEKLKPDGLSAEYFGSALYTLCGFYQLGSLVPLSCYGKTGGQTVKSLAEIFDYHCRVRSLR